ncbi:MAG: LptA/OstA family protein [Armatimonadetes bacterium]|nr:LptA/OstA family protein [Armatimonadota bacterium]
MTVGALMRYFVAAGMVGAAGMIGLRLGETRAPVAPVAASPTAMSQQAPAVTATRPVMSYTRGAKPAWRAKLRSLQIRGGGQALSAGPLEEALIYGTHGEPVVRVTAAGIKGQAGQRDFTVQGPVHAVAERGAILRAAQVDWYDAQQRLHCSGPVTARFRNALLQAPEADYLIGRDEVIVPGQVRLYVGRNLVVGQRLTYNIVTESFQLERVRMVLHAEEARRALEELRR